MLLEVKHADMHELYQILKLVEERLHAGGFLYYDKRKWNRTQIISMKSNSRTKSAMLYMIVQLLYELEILSDPSCVSVAFANRGCLW